MWGIRNMQSSAMYDNLPFSLGLQREMASKMNALNEPMTPKKFFLSSV